MPLAAHVAPMAAHGDAGFPGTFQRLVGEALLRRRQPATGDEQIGIEIPCVIGHQRIYPVRIIVDEKDVDFAVVAQQFLQLTAVQVPQLAVTR